LIERLNVDQPLASKEKTIKVKALVINQYALYLGSGCINHREVSGFLNPSLGCPN